MELAIKEQKMGAYGVAALTIPMIILSPSLPVAILIGIVSSASAGFAYSLSINAAKIDAELAEAKKIRLELEARHSDVLGVKKQLKELREKQVIELENYKSRFESELQRYKDEVKTGSDKEVSDRVSRLEKDYLQKTKDFRSIQIARLAYVVREKEALEDYVESERIRLVTEQKESLEEFREVFAGFEGQLKEAQTDYRATYTAKTEEIKALHNTLAKTNNVKAFTGSDKASIVGNKVLDYFLKHGMTLDAEKSLTKLDSSILWLRPRGTSLKAIESHLEALQLSFELITLPVAEIADGCIKLTLQDASISLPAKIIEPSIDRFIEALTDSNHVRVTAPTDSGKSVLLDNILGIYSDIYEGKQNLTLLDPKYPFTEWSGHTPDYKGFDECLGAMALLQTKIEKRLIEAKDLADRGLSIPDYEPELFAIDELELLYADALSADGEKKGDVTKALVKSINTGLKIGRGLTKTKGKGIKVLYVTQSPLCSKIGLNKDAFDQSTSIFLGSNIPLVLQDGGELDGKILAAKRKLLDKEYSTRIAAGQQYLMLIRMPNGGDCFLMQCPKPGTFKPAVLDSKTSSEASTSGCNCPNCGTLSITPNGFYKPARGAKRNRWKCLNTACKSKTFTEPEK